MQYEFEKELKEGYILITASGGIDSMDELFRMSKAIHEVAGQVGCRRFLVDERLVTKNIDPHVLTLFAEGRADDIDNRLRVAIVYTPENVSKLRWMETFFQNRSLAYRQFSSFDEAREWLLSTRP